MWILSQDKTMMVNDTGIVIDAIVIDDKSSALTISFPALRTNNIVGPEYLGRYMSVGKAKEELLKIYDKLPAEGKHEVE